MSQIRRGAERLVDSVESTTSRERDNIATIPGARSCQTQSSTIWSLIQMPLDMGGRERATPAEICGEMTHEGVSGEQNTTTIASSAIGAVALNATVEMRMAGTMSEDESEPVAPIDGVTTAETEVGIAIAGTTATTGTVDDEYTRSLAIGLANTWRETCFLSGCKCTCILRVEIVM